jgi:methylenetetrahydrofolate reductase (NADPH)
VALRGDPPGGMGGEYTPHPDGYCNAADLVAGLKKIGNFQISIAGYPEKHPDSPDAKADLENLKRKVDAGADRCITQFFFDADDFLRFRDRAAAAGIHVPIVPGIMPVSNFQGISRMAGLCGSKVPAWLAELFQGLDDDVETRRMIAASVAGDLCRRLRDEGVDQFHFYTLNRADLTFAICHLLGVRPR